MPPLTRRDFLILAGAAGASIVVTCLGKDWLLRYNNPESKPNLESTMPSNSPSLMFTSGYAAADQPGIHAFLFDEISGALTPHGSFTGIANPSFLVVHPNGRWLYAVSEAAKDSDGRFGEVWSFRFEREPFAIEAMNHQTSNGDWPCHLRIDATGKWIIAANYGTGSAAVYPLLDDGSLGEMTDFVQHSGKGPNEKRQEGPHAHSSTFTPDNRFVIIADLGIDQLVIYSFDTATGKLGLHSAAKSQPGAGPRHTIFHPNGKWFYAANELGSTVSAYEYDAANGTLAEKQTISTLPADEPANGPENIVADIHISDSGKRLYVSNRGHNSIAVFDINDDGSLKLVSITSCGGNWPRNFALAPNGKFLLVANQYSNEICVLPVLEGQAALGTPDLREPVTGASCIQFV
jgi:6-phosphogluconolactonase